MKDLKDVIFEECAKYCDACSEPANFDAADWYEQEEEKEKRYQRFKALFAVIVEAGLESEYEAYREA